MSQLFNRIKVASTSRSTFDLSHHQVTTSDFGYLVPICMREMVPNDDFVVTPQLFCRLTNMAVPTYGKITCRIHHFFVPNRVIYPHWDAWISQDQSNATTPPYFTHSTLVQALNSDPQVNGGSTSIINRGVYARLMANLGLNPISVHSGYGLGANDRINALPFLAYYRIWLDWFMDSSVNDHATMVAAFNELIKDGGNLTLQATDFLKTRNACFKKDYFTTAKLNPQDGNPSSVAVDLASQITNPALYDSSSSATGIQKIGNSSKVAVSGQFSSSTGKIGDFTIEALRAANSLQRYLERNNFVGTKIINRLLAHFGISPSPERLDMAEFIGGGSFPILIGDVTSHAAFPETDDAQSLAGLGAQAGKGVGAGKGETVRYHAKEHGIFMSIMSILPDTGYFQGIPKIWTRGVNGDALDYFTPEFENLGYQPVLNKEVYVPKSADYSTYDADGIFGWQPQYADYKFQNDVLAGDMIGSTDPSVTYTWNQDSWHLFRELSFDDNDPLALNNNFVECNNHNNSYDRIFNLSDNDYDHFYFNIDVDVKATRPMTGFGEPSLSATNEGDGNSMNLPYGGTRL